MNKHIKNIIAVVLCGLCMPAMATDRFIVKYKLNETQKAFLSSHRGVDIKKAESQIRKELMEKLSKEQLDVLSKAADVKITTKIQVIDSHSLATGAHVIILSEDLDAIQTEQFIHNVKQNDNIEYIEEDKELRTVKC